MRTYRSRVIILIALLAIGLIPAIQAQEVTSIALSISVTEEEVYNELITEFEAQNPNIDVRLITNPFQFGFNEEDPESIDEVLDGIRANVTDADVLTVNNDTLTLEATRAGYYLDLTPLVQIDATLNELDFYQAMWQSYQWDNGIWALPYSGDVNLLLYDTAAFDNAGLFYPDDTWTLSDLDNAIRELTEYDEDGRVVRSAIFDFTDGSGLYASVVSVLGRGVYDELASPSVPDFSEPFLEDALTILADLNREGLLGVSQGDFAEPILLAPSVLATAGGNFSDGRNISLLPGGRSSVAVNGYAVSAGTQAPEAAYELAKFLTLQRDIVEGTGDIPARRSFAEEIRLPQFDQTVEPLIRQALDNALSISELRFAEDLETVVTDMVARDVDARTALNDVELEILERLQIASNRQGTEDLTITQEEEIVLQPGEIALNFGVVSLIAPLPTQEEWEALIDDFTTLDFEVRDIRLDVIQNFINPELETLTSEYDCFYLPDNQVPGADLPLLRNMDPLMASDPNFDSTDFVSNILTLVQRNDQTWAMPLVVQPQVMFYNADLFNRFGIPEPRGTWTVPEFEDALFNIRLSDQDPAPFRPDSLGGTYIQVLMGAYGALPIDYRTEPPTLQFDDPAVIDAAREVLDLAKDGYIEYTALTEGFGFGLQLFASTNEEIAIYNRLLNPIGDFLPAANSSDSDQLITFPQGTQINAVSYDLGTAYISAQTQYAEACYRFISEMSLSPQLFNEMPARRSQINNPRLLEEQSEDAVNFYNSLDALLQQPNTVLIPTPITGALENAPTFLTTLWLNRAFDRYVLEDADLQLELQEAQQFATEFRACTEGLEQPDPNTDAFGLYIANVVTCATGVDPTFGQLIGLN